MFGEPKQVILYRHELAFSVKNIITETNWEEAKAKLIDHYWEEGEETTEGTIAYVSTEHKNVMVRSTHGIREFDGRSLQRKKDQTQEEFVANALAKYFDEHDNYQIFLKIVTDALIDWESEQNG